MLSVSFEGRGDDGNPGAIVTVAIEKCGWSGLVWQRHERIQYSMTNNKVEFNNESESRRR